MLTLRLRVSLTAGALALASLALQAADSNDKIARGKYLAEEVAHCQDCHTPRLESGEFDKEKWMKGAILDFQPIQQKGKWHKTAPDLTSSGNLIKRWKAVGLQKFLETGLGPRGNAADPPMPAYKLTKDDAEAIVAYLQSLP